MTKWLQMKTLGKKPSGARLEKIQKSPQFKDGKFQNILPSDVSPKGSALITKTFEFFTSGSKTMPPRPVPHLKTDLHHLPDQVPTIVWFGHSSYLIKYRGKTLLVDPVFSGHASPFSWMVKSFPGSDAYAAEDMPEIDFLIITHDHYDHLDYQTVLKLKSKIKHIYTALGVAEHLEYWDFPPEMITEMDWWETQNLIPGFELTATPARHFSGRSFSRSETLWASFVLKMDQYKLFIGGDSGFDGQFKVIGEKYGPFDWAFLECGQYNEGWPLIHMFPERTAQAAHDLGAKILMPVHWAKFSLSLHRWNEPIYRVIESAKKLNQKLAIPKIGQVISIDQAPPMTPWWED